MKTLIAIVALTLASSAVFAHSGGTNAAGCHHVRATGEYHCHAARALRLRWMTGWILLLRGRRKSCWICCGNVPLLLLRVQR